MSGTPIFFGPSYFEATLPCAHCTNSVSGELDDTRLIEGITGEKTIYKRRGEQEPEPGAVQEKPKRLRLGTIHILRKQLYSTKLNLTT